MAIKSSSSSSQPTETRLDTDTTKPSTTAPGDGPADTTDPTERATTVLPSGELSEESLNAGTVNAVQPLPKVEEEQPTTTDKSRIERYEATAPTGETVTIEHNLDTGETKRV